MLLPVAHRAPVAERIIAPEYFEESQLGFLPGRVTFLPGDRRAFLDTLDGWVHVYEPELQYDTAMQLDGFFSKIFRPVKKLFKKVVSIPKKIFDQIKQNVSKLNEQRKKIFRKVTTNKYTRQLLRVAGVALSPFTAGLSLAVAEGAARYGKARYVQGQSRSSAWKRGAVGAAIGYVGGRAVSAGYQAIQRGGLTALNPFTSSATQAAGTTAASTGTQVATGAAQTSGGLWGTVGKTALSIGKKVGTTFATSYLTQMASGQKPNVEHVAYDALAAEVLPEQYKGVYDSWANAGYGEGYPSYAGGGGSMPFGTEVPDGEYFTDQNGMNASGGFGKYLPIVAVVGVVGAAGYLMLKGKGR